MPVQDKTEPASPRRRQEARDEGRVARSGDVNAAIVLIVSLFILKAAGPYMMSNLTGIVSETFRNLHSRSVSPEGLPSLMGWYGMRFALLCLPIAAGTMAVALAANVLQVGLKVTPKALMPQMSRIDPLKGITRLFSWRSLIELLKSILKLSVVAYFVYSFLQSHREAMIDLAGMPPSGIAASLGGLCWGLLIRGCSAMLVLGLLDYIYQRFQFENSIKMSKQELKDEYKRSEGDPQIKGRIKQRQREMARRRMVQDVATADVVVTNPTHIAVALKYDSQKMNAPIVVAKGQRLLAQKIKAVAEAHSVPIVENKPIARLLYKEVEIGQAIPDNLYQAVAEILAYVYQLSRRAATAA